MVDEWCDPRATSHADPVDDADLGYPQSRHFRHVVKDPPKVVLFASPTASIPESTDVRGLGTPRLGTAAPRRPTQLLCNDSELVACCRHGLVDVCAHRDRCMASGSPTRLVALSNASSPVGRQRKSPLAQHITHCQWIIRSTLDRRVIRDDHTFPPGDHTCPSPHQPEDHLSSLASPAYLPIPVTRPAPGRGSG